MLWEELGEKRILAMDVVASVTCLPAPSIAKIAVFYIDSQRI